MADQRDVIEVLTHDHGEVEQMFTELQTLPGMTGEGRRVGARTSPTR